MVGRSTRCCQVWFWIGQFIAVPIQTTLALHHLICSFHLSESQIKELGHPITFTHLQIHFSSLQQFNTLINNMNMNNYSFFKYIMAVATAFPQQLSQIHTVQLCMLQNQHFSQIHSGLDWLHHHSILMFIMFQQSTPIAVQLPFNFPSPSSLVLITPLPCSRAVNSSVKSLHNTVASSHFTITLNCELSH